MSAALPAIPCIGAAHWDIIGHVNGAAGRGADLPGRVRRAPGGVALNLALALRREGLAAALIAAVGDDVAATELEAALSARGVDCRGLSRVRGGVTGAYVGIEDAGGLVAAVADTRAADAAGRALLRGLAAHPRARIAVVDGNLSPGVLTALAEMEAPGTRMLCVAGASPAKAPVLRAVLAHPRVVLYLNRAEAAALCAQPCADTATAARALRDAGAAAALVTDGAAPVAWADAAGCIRATPPTVRAKRVTGAGDALMAAHLAARLRGLDATEALVLALARAAEHISGSE